jgi:hypothetical protein
MFDRDPEELGPEHPDDLELRMDTQQSIHTFQPGPDGRCQARLIRHGMLGATCGSTQRSSVLHDDAEADFRMRHNHGGGDCMCFEDEDGPSFYEAMKQYVDSAGRERPQW